MGWNPDKVAPLVGAWIEMYDVSLTNNSYASLLSWERGLKCFNRRVVVTLCLVAPLVGAWIEITP